MDHYAEARAALATWDDQTIEIIGDDGYLIRGIIARAEWVIKKLRAAIEAPVPARKTPEELAEQYLPREGALDSDRITGTYKDFLTAITAAVREAQQGPTPAQAETPEQIVQRILEGRARQLEGNEKLYYPDEPAARAAWWDEPGDAYALMIASVDAGIQVARRTQS